MQIMKWLGIVAAAALITSLFFPWITIESRNITVSGFESAGTKFGKPGIIHLFFALSYIILLLVNRIWSLRAAIFFNALHMGWAIRNYVLISACSGGICPEKQPAIYLLVFFALMMLVTN